MMRFVAIVADQMRESTIGQILIKLHALGMGRFTSNGNIHRAYDVSHMQESNVSVHM